MIRSAVEALIRLLQTEVLPNSLLIGADDVFEVNRVPCLLLQGPRLSENRQRRTMAQVIRKNQVSATYSATRAPRLYHLDFEVVLTSSGQADLLELQSRLARFYQLRPVLPVDEDGSLNITEQVPCGGLQRPNFSDLKQSSGRLRLEDCPVFDGRITTGPLIRERRFTWGGDVAGERRFVIQE